MFHDVKAASASPSKGKAKEENHWHAGWWEFYPLLEQARRPVEWSSSSIIFTCHPTQPLLTARHFSSSKQFVIPSPPPIASAPSSYEPSTIISVAPSDDWLFAYFPGRDIDGTGCLWKRGPRIDNWDIKEYWSFARGAGVIAANWLGGTREWTSYPTAVSTRLPPRGPRTPVSNPTLLLVTQSHQLNVYYFRNYIPSLKVISCSLLQPQITGENRPRIGQDVSNGLDGVKTCVNAAIGLGYNESSILIATHSHLYPPPTAMSQSNTLDFNVSLDMSRQFSVDSPSTEWVAWGEESMIDLCEIRLTFDGIAMNLFSLPYSWSNIGLSSIPLHPIHHSGHGLTSLAFICTPPQPAPDPTRSSPLSHKNETEPGRMYLAASYLDFTDYTSAPKSELVLHSFARNTSTSSTNKFPWISHHESTRTFSPDVLMFFAPRAITLGPRAAGIYVGIMKTSGTFSSRKKVKEVATGTVKVLKLPDLIDGETLESSIILSSVDRVGRELPLNATVSPNDTLFCSVSSALWTTQTSIYKLPKRSWNHTSFPGIQSTPTVSFALASAILSGKTTSDVSHVLSLPSTPIDEVVDTLHYTFGILEGHENGIPGKLFREALGLAVEVYRLKAQQADEEAERDSLASRWQTAHDMCSIAACNMAFEECRDGDMYDLEAVWQLIGLSSWLLSFVEKLMRECLLSHDLSSLEPSNESSDDLFGSNPPSPMLEFQRQPLDSPILLHLVQTQALASLHAAVNHVRLFHNQLGALTARGENAQIARDVMFDLVNCSGLDVNALELLLADLIKAAKTTASDDTRSLALCQPTVPMYNHLRKVIQMLTNASAIHKPCLFIKPSDLVDGISQLSLEARGKEQGKDVVTKGTLINHGMCLICVRCGGKSEVGGKGGVTGHDSHRWHAWEKVWTRQCICGGFWVRGGT